MGRTDLDWQLKRAAARGNSAFIEAVATLRMRLFRAAMTGDWPAYETVRKELNAEGAAIPYRPYEKPKGQEQLTMGMFDKPQYLTSQKAGEGFVEPGETFWLHKAAMADTVDLGHGPRDQVKLRVSKERDSETVVVYTAGAGIVNQVKRMDVDDMRAMPFEVRLDQIPSRKGNPTNVLTPADQDPPTGASAAAAVSADDF